MKQTIQYFLLPLLWLLAGGMTLKAQNLPDADKKPLATILIPLDLDSAFRGYSYKYGNDIPGYFINGLEFYNGVKMAAETLAKEGHRVKMEVVDMRGTDYDLKRLAAKLDGQPALVISAATSAIELKNVAEALKPYRIPLISLLPNDAGITGYPEFIIINPTLQRHCTQLFKLLQRQHSIDNLIMIAPDGVAETRLMGYIEDAAAQSRSAKLDYKKLAMADRIDTSMLLPLVDSLRHNVLIVPSLQTGVAQKVVAAAAMLGSEYRCTVIGMPTWETIAFNKPEYRGVDVLYGTPFLTSMGNANQYAAFTKNYRSMTNALPGDFASRGYEITLRYVRLLARFGKNFLAHVNDEDAKVFNDFSLQPVTDRNSNVVHYLENEKIYFIKKTDGSIKTFITP